MTVYLRAWFLLGRYTPHIALLQSDIYHAGALDTESLGSAATVSHCLSIAKDCTSATCALRRGALAIWRMIELRKHHEDYLLDFPFMNLTNTHVSFSNVDVMYSAQGKGATELQDCPFLLRHPLSYHHIWAIDLSKTLCLFDLCHHLLP